jgi:DNA-binding NarL/FixJ family response regulator
VVLLDQLEVQEKPKALRILVADNHEVVRRGLEAIFTAGRDWIVVGEAARGRDAMRLALELEPDVVVMDIAMPDLNGLDAAQKLAAELPDTKVLILTMHTSEVLWKRALESGARGIVLKTDSAAEIVEAVQTVAQGRLYFAASISRPLLDAFRRMADPALPPDPAAGPLTWREREIVQLVCEGRTNREIAESLKISVRTVETHRANVMEKLGLKSLSSLIRWAIRNHLIEA